MVEHRVHRIFVVNNETEMKPVRVISQSDVLQNVLRNWAKNKTEKKKKTKWQRVLGKGVHLVLHQHILQSSLQQKCKAKSAPSW